MRRLITAFLIVLSLGMLTAGVMAPHPAAAAPILAPDATAAEKTCNKSGFLGLPTWYRYLDVDKDCNIVGPKAPGTDNLDWTKVVSRVALAVVDILLRVGGMVAVGFVIYGGFSYITSQGEPENTKRAQETILNAVIGLVIAIFSVAIVSFLGNILWK